MRLHAPRMVTRLARLAIGATAALAFGVTCHLKSLANETAKPETDPLKLSLIHI